MSETERSFRTPGGPPWRSEPFRLFFPLGIALGWVGIGHWLLYATGTTSTYSCLMHGLVQMQAFLMAFAIGFLFTAIPRRTQSAAPSALEIALAVALLVGVASALVAEAWIAAQLGYLLVFALLLQFAVRRLLGRAAGRRPPAAFVLIPIGILHGIAGAILLAMGLGLGDRPWSTMLGALFVQQGVFLCFTTGVGGLVLPLMAGGSPPRDLGSSPAETAKAVAYAAVGAAICASFLLEASGYVRTAPLLRAAVVLLGLGLGGGALRPPATPGIHRRLTWIAVWLIPIGLAASGLLPDYRVPALHVLFIGGFSLLTLGVATHVVLSHLELQALALGRPPAIVLIGVLVLAAMAARVVADWSDTYFTHLAWAAGAWILATLLWLGFLGPKLLRRSAPAASE